MWTKPLKPFERLHNLTENALVNYVVNWRLAIWFTIYILYLVCSASIVIGRTIDRCGSVVIHIQDLLFIS